MHCAMDWNIRSSNRLWGVVTRPYAGDCADRRNTMKHPKLNYRYWTVRMRRPNTRQWIRVVDNLSLLDAQRQRRALRKAGWQVDLTGSQ
jgi:hypothetical protein